MLEQGETSSSRVPKKKSLSDYSSRRRLTSDGARPPASHRGQTLAPIILTDDATTDSTRRFDSASNSRSDVLDAAAKPDSSAAAAKSQTRNTAGETSRSREKGKARDTSSSRTDAMPVNARSRGRASRMASGDAVLISMMESRGSIPRVARRSGIWNMGLEDAVLDVENEKGSPQSGVQAPSAKDTVGNSKDDAANTEITSGSKDTVERPPGPLGDDGIPKASEQRVLETPGIQNSVAPVSGAEKLQDIRSASPLAQPLHARHQLSNQSQSSRKHGVDESGTFRILVRGLPHGLTDEILLSRFSKFGAVRAIITRYSVHGKNSVYGHVYFTQRQHAENAIGNMDFVLIDDSLIRCSFGTYLTEPDSIKYMYADILPDGHSSLDYTYEHMLAKAADGVQEYTNDPSNTDLGLLIEMSLVNQANPLPPESRPYSIFYSSTMTLTLLDHIRGSQIMHQELRTICSFSLLKDQTFPEVIFDEQIRTMFGHTLNYEIRLVFKMLQNLTSLLNELAPAFHEEFVHEFFHEFWLVPGKKLLRLLVLNHVVHCLKTLEPSEVIKADIVDLKRSKMFAMYTTILTADGKGFRFMEEPPTLINNSVMPVNDALLPKSRTSALLMAQDCGSPSRYVPRAPDLTEYPHLHSAVVENMHSQPAANSPLSSIDSDDAVNHHLEGARQTKRKRRASSPPANDRALRNTGKTMSEVEKGHRLESLEDPSVNGHLEKRLRKDDFVLFGDFIGDTAPAKEKKRSETNLRNHDRRENNRDLDSVTPLSESDETTESLSNIKELKLARTRSGTSGSPIRRRKRARSESFSTESPIKSGRNGTRKPPPTGHDLDQLKYHIDLQDFGKGVQEAVTAVFSTDRRSRYTQVSALLISWEDEDPRLPVSIEISALKAVFVDLYGFAVEEYQIPTTNSHKRLNQKILDFFSDEEPKHLKIIYYAGHGKLSAHGQSVWTSWRNSSQDRCPTVKWAGIQTVCEESESDVLILLDCCASGVSNSDEGNGVTELIAACPFNSIANGVGQFSFTHALITQLRKLVHMPSFNVGHLYNHVFTTVQGWQVENPMHKKPPIHLVLTQDQRFTRSITLSSMIMNSRPRYLVPAGDPPNQNSPQSPAQQNQGDQNSSSESNSEPGGVISPFDSDGASSASSVSPPPEYPRLLFSIRISEDIDPRRLSKDLFADWLGMIPVAAKSVRVEAGFASDSTLLMVSVPVAFIGYMPTDPAITLLGISRSANLLRNESVPGSVNVETTDKAAEPVLETSQEKEINISSGQIKSHDTEGTDVPIKVHEAEEKLYIKLEREKQEMAAAEWEDRIYELEDEVTELKDKLEHMVQLYTSLKLSSSHDYPSRDEGYTSWKLSSKDDYPDRGEQGTLGLRSPDTTPQMPPKASRGKIRLPPSKDPPSPEKRFFVSTAEFESTVSNDPPIKLEDEDAAIDLKTTPEPHP